MTGNLFSDVGIGPLTILRPGLLVFYDRWGGGGVGGFRPLLLCNTENIKTVTTSTLQFGVIHSYTKQPSLELKERHP